MADFKRNEITRQMNALRVARGKDAAAKARSEIYKNVRPLPESVRR